jgi:phosphoglycolate phosphatase-like HAD superfamily hydrolase
LRNLMADFLQYHQRLFDGDGTLLNSPGYERSVTHVAERAAAMAAS